MQDITKSTVLLPDSISLGMKASFRALVDKDLIARFSSFSGDWNPLHNEVDFALKLGFKGKVAHGAIQQALISRLIGMQLPGQFAIIKKVTTSYSLPVYEGEHLDVEGVVSKWNRQERSGQIEINIKSVADNRQFSYSVVDFGVNAEAAGSDAFKAASQGRSTISHDSSRKTIVVLGGGSAIAMRVCEFFPKDTYQVIRVGRKDADFNCDFAEEPHKLADILLETRPFAVMHFASLPPQKASTTDIDLKNLGRNIDIHIAPLATAGRLVREKTLPELKRIVLLGSIGARHLLGEKGYEAYSYAKMLSSYYVKDLARDLARFKVTVNAIAPGEIPVGMNANLSQKTQTILEARIPSGQLTKVEDIANTMTFLLSDSADSVTGQEILLAGGRL